MSAEPVLDLAHARAAFEQWRAQRPGPGRLPEHLWALAESLVPKISCPGRRTRARPQRRSCACPPRRADAQAEARHQVTFVELRRVDIAQAARSATVLDQAGVSLQIDCADGTRLTLTVSLRERSVRPSVKCESHCADRIRPSLGAACSASTSLSLTNQLPTP
jgi:hypothetical protein